MGVGGGGAGPRERPAKPAKAEATAKDRAKARVSRQGLGAWFRWGDDYDYDCDSVAGVESHDNGAG